MQKNIFSEEELKVMGQLTLDLLQNSIENDEKENALKLSRRMYNEFLAMHDLYRDWITHLLTFIGKRYGDKVLYESLEETVGDFTRRLASRYEGKSARKKIEMLYAGLRGHLQPIKIEEDGEKIIITSEICGSGGRLVKEGAYSPQGDFLRIEKPQPMTFNQPNFPVYCAHCYFQNNTLIEPDEKPLFITEPSSDPGNQPCRIYIYK